MVADKTIGLYQHKRQETLPYITVRELIQLSGQTVTHAGKSDLQYLLRNPDRIPFDFSDQGKPDPVFLFCADKRPHENGKQSLGALYFENAELQEGTYWLDDLVSSNFHAIILVDA